MKSTTAPNRTRSIILPMAPPTIRASAKVSRKRVARTSQTPKPAAMATTTATRTQRMTPWDWNIP